MNLLLRGRASARSNPLLGVRGDYYREYSWQAWRRFTARDGSQ